MTFILTSPETQDSDPFQLPEKRSMCFGDSKIWVQILCLLLTCSVTLGLSLLPQVMQKPKGNEWR